MKNLVITLTVSLTSLFFIVTGLYILASLMILAGVLVAYLINEVNKAEEIKNFLIELNDGSILEVKAKNFNEVRTLITFTQLMIIKEYKIKSDLDLAV